MVRRAGQITDGQVRITLMSVTSKRSPESRQVRFRELRKLSPGARLEALIQRGDTIGKWASDGGEWDLARRAVVSSEKAL